MAAAGKADYAANCWRLGERSRVPAPQGESEQIRDRMVEAAADAETVCAYVPMGTEPGSPEILDALSRVCPTVLLPVALAGPDGEHLPLQWGRYVPGQLTRGRFGAQEPPSRGCRHRRSRPRRWCWFPLWPSTAAECDWAGGGLYDRSLPLCTPGARLVAVVRDDEVLDALPAEPHDVRMTHALTPVGGLITLRECPVADGGSSTWRGRVPIHPSPSEVDVPTYSYACTECDNRFDAVQAFTDDALTTCPRCSGRLQAVQLGGRGLQGSGFYRTDSRDSASKSSGASSSGEKSGGRRVLER